MSEKGNEPKVFELNAQTFFIPMSIIIAGFIIAGSIFMTNGGANTPNVNTDAALGNAGELLEDAVESAPEVTVSVDDDPVIGEKAEGKLAIVEFSDYECPFCKRFRDTTYEELKDKYINAGEAFLVFRDLPLPFHDPAATDLANAAECVQENAGDAAYFTFHDLIFANTGTNGAGIPAGTLGGLIAEAGASRASVESCMSEGRFKDEIAKDIDDATAIGINGTPGFVIGTYTEDGSVEGIAITGAQPFDVFERAIERVRNN